MSKKKPTVILLPPGGTRIRFLQIGVMRVFFLFLLLGIGFAGYFIPFNAFTLDVVEQNQKRNLTEQNRALLQRIIAMRQTLQAVRVQMGKLENKRSEIDELAATRPLHDQPAKSRGKKRASLSSIGEVAGVVHAGEVLSDHILSLLKSQPSYFSRIPLRLPVAGTPVISVPYGMLKDPFTGKPKFHHGVDFIAPRGTAILATADGVVAKSENHKYWGKRIVIQHSPEFSTVYAHLGQVNIAPGRRVKRGDVIGEIGESGLTTGPHLHYEILRNNVHVKPDDYFFPDLDSTIIIAYNNNP